MLSATWNLLCTQKLFNIFLIVLCLTVSTQVNGVYKSLPFSKKVCIRKIDG